MRISKSCLACVGAVALLGPLRVLAADTTPPAGQLEEITVTAQKRTETVQDVPLSMTTFSSAALEQKAINTFFDYATKVPNLAFAPTGDGVGTARTISIRGVSGNNVTGFYVDDTPLPDSLDPQNSGHRSHRGVARTAGHPLRRTFDGRLGAPGHHGTGYEQSQRGRAYRRVLDRAHRPGELDRRRGGQYPDHPGQGCTEIERLLRLRGRATSSAPSAPIRRRP